MPGVRATYVVRRFFSAFPCAHHADKKATTHLRVVHYASSPAPPYTLRPSSMPPSHWRNALLIRNLQRAALLNQLTRYERELVGANRRQERLVQTQVGGGAYGGAASAAGGQGWRGVGAFPVSNACMVTGCSGAASRHGPGP